MAETPRRSTLTLDVGQRGLRACLAALAEFCGETGLPDALQADLALCAEELLTNVMNHGGHQAAFTVEAGLLPEGGVGLEVRDDGPPFDPLAAAPPSRGEAPGGWGIALVKGIAAEATYRRDGMLNVVRLVLR